MLTLRSLNKLPLKSLCTSLTNLTTRHYWQSVDKIEHKEPFSPIPGKYPQELTAEESVSQIKSFQKCFVHGAAATPEVLIDALCEHASANNLKGIELVHIHIDGDAPHVSEKYAKHFRDNSLFIGSNVRKAVNAGKADYTPIFLSEIPRLLEDPDFGLDWAIIQVSEEDKNGYHSLGTSVDCTRSAILAAKNVIGLVNKKMPRVLGDGFIHTSHFDSIVRVDIDLHELKFKSGDPISNKIGDLIANQLVPDKACLQMGIGNIPDAVLAALKNHRHIGVHTEMFSDGVLDLLELGVVSNQYKYHHRGKLVSSFCAGTKRLYDYIHNNPLIFLADVSYVNDTGVIRANDNVHAINSCLEVDITGQVCSDSIGTRMYSGVGGQMDFMRGAILSNGGKAIMAMPSVTKKGDSKIKDTLTLGAGVVTTRSHIQYIVTEYGFAKLYGKTLRERAKLLIDIAHPDHREQLEKDAINRFGPLQLYDSEYDDPRY